MLVFFDVVQHAPFSTSVKFCFCYPGSLKNPGSLTTIISHRYIAHVPCKTVSMRFFLYPVLIVLLLSVSAVFPADNRAAPVRVTPLVPVEEQWEPSAVPDRIVLSWSDDPSTTMSVTWRTDTSVRQAIGEIAPAEGGPKFVSKTENDRRCIAVAGNESGTFAEAHGNIPGT